MHTQPVKQLVQVQGWYVRCLEREEQGNSLEHGPPEPPERVKGHTDVFAAWAGAAS